MSGPARRRGSTNPLVDEVRALRAEVAKMKAAQVRYVEAPVTAVDPAGTFTVDVGGGQQLSGIQANQQFLPTVGDTARLAVAGAQPIYQHDQIAEDAITQREIAPGAVTETALAFTLEDLGGTNVYYGSSTPTGTVTAGDLWVKVVAAGPPPQHETRRWDGDSWELLADQRTTQALLDAQAAAQAAAAADQKGVDALANAATAQQTASGAQTTAASKAASFTQASPPATTGRTVGDEWIDSDDGFRRYYWNGTAWTTSPLGAAGISATARQLGALTIYRQASAPSTGVLDGDFWIDSDDGKPYVRVAGAWVLSEDAEVNTAISNAATAQATADSKVRIFAQASAPTGLTAADDGDQWIDTDEGNRQYIWQASGTVQRTNWAINSGFEYDAVAASVAAVTGWDTGGVGAGTVTRSITTTGATSGTRAAKLVGSSLAIATTNSLYLRQTIPAAPGDVVRAQCTASVLVASTSFPVEMLVEWRNASGTILGSGTFLGTGSTGTQTLVYTSAALPANTADVMVTVRRRGTGAGTALTNADITVDSVLVERNRPATAPTTYFDGSSGGEARWDAGTPHLTTSTTWQEGTAGSYAWQPRLMRTAALQPGSIVASTVVATGTISAALLEALMVLTTVLIAGNPNGDHTRIDAVGVRAYAADPNDGIPNEVARFGRSSGGRDAAGRLTWQVDELGNGSFTGLSSTADPKFKGELLSTSLDRKANIVAWTYKWPSPGSTTNEVGLVELSFKARKGHSYIVRATGLYADVAGADSQTVPFHLRATFDGSRPTITSQMMETCNVDAKFDIYPWENQSGEITNLHHAGSDQTVRYLLTIQKPTQGTSVAYWADYTYHASFMYVVDMGLTPGDSGQPNTGNGTLLSGGTASAPANPKQDSELIFNCTWSKSYDGNNNPLPYGEAYQGYNPAYPLGNTRSFIGFQDLTSVLAGATIRYVKVYLYYSHWYRMDGGYPQVGVHANTAAPATATGQLALGPAPTPWVGRNEGLWLELPSSWWGGFQSGAHRGIALGPGPNLDGGYGGRANGWNQPNFPLLAVGITK